MRRGSRGPVSPAPFDDGLPGSPLAWLGLLVRATVALVLIWSWLVVVLIGLG